MGGLPAILNDQEVIMSTEKWGSEADELPTNQLGSGLEDWRNCSSSQSLVMSTLGFTPCL